jgi:muramoyltetrapeptide carboxypeptidase LdcA involved in peptidoglycan recycling
MKIAIFTSSTPIGALSPARAIRAIEYLTRQGHEVILGTLFYQQDFYRSGTIKQRAQELNELVQHQPIDLLLSAIGGANTSSILPFLDYEAINQNVKAVCGFSDTTALLSAIGRKCPQVKVIYGSALLPNFGEFEVTSQDISYRSLMQALTDQLTELQSSGFIYEGQPANWEEFEGERIKVPLT